MFCNSLSIELHQLIVELEKQYAGRPALGSHESTEQRPVRSKERKVAAGDQSTFTNDRGGQAPLLVGEREAPRAKSAKCWPNVV